MEHNKMESAAVNLPPAGLETVSPKKMLLLIAPVCSTEMPALGPACICASVKKAGYDCRITDLNLEFYHALEHKKQSLWNREESSHIWTEMANVEKLYLENVDFFKMKIDLMRVCAPAVIGFTIWHTNTNMSLLLASEIRRVMPDVKIVFGGPEVPRIFSTPGMYPDSYLTAVDLFVLGEGEIIAPKLLAMADDFQGLMQQSGINFNADLKTIRSLEQVDLNSLPTPDFTSLNLSEYSGLGVLPLYSSRGCVNKCIYCDERKLWTGFRSRSAENIFNDVILSRKRHPEFREIIFSDSLTNGDIRELRKFALLLADTKTGIVWHGYAVLRPEMDKELLDILARSGCVKLHYGLETASKRVMKFIGKQMPIKADIGKIVKETSECGIKVFLSFMFGLPSESDDDALENIEFVKKYHEYIYGLFPSYAFCNVCPGTDAHDHPELYGICPNPDPCFWESTDGTNTYPVRMARFERFVRFLHDNKIYSSYPYPEFLQRDRMLAQYYQYMGNRPKAIEHLEEAIRREPEDKSLRESLAKLHSEKEVKQFSVLSFFNSFISLFSKGGRRLSVGREAPDLAQITKRLDQQAFGGVDFINGISSPAAGAVIPVSGDYIEVAGIYVDAVKGDVAAGVIVMVAGKPFKAIYGGERPDIARANNNPKYLKSQFYLKIPTAAVGKGVHDVTVRVVSNDRLGFYESSWNARLDVK